MKNWLKHFFLIGLLFILLLGAIIYRGSDGLIGITWGSDEYYCKVVDISCGIKATTLPIKLGMYDPNLVYDTFEHLAVDHYFVSLTETENLSTVRLNKLEESNQKNRWPLVTVEPWKKQGLDSNLVLEDIISGKYDTDIKNTCEVFQDYNKPLFIRFGHEMERVTGRYPWAVQNSTHYIDAYHYFVSYCKKIYTQGFYVWSPAGDHGLDSYYPGDEFVDYVGLSVYGLEKFDRDIYGYMRSFEDNFGEKYNRVKKYNKPVIIAEIGISGTPAFQKKWLKEGLENSDQFPLLKIVVYFNSKDNEGAWGKEYGIPDWRIDTTIIDK
jgi:beta-mannanase